METRKPSRSKQAPAFIYLLALIVAFSLAIVVSPEAQSTIGRNQQQIILVGKTRFYITVQDGDLSVSRADLVNYVRDAARAVVAYYGSFPVQRVAVEFTPTDDDGVGYGSSTYNDDDDYGVITINIGDNASRRTLQDSWTLTHEMMHLAFPVVSHHHRWLAEGIATYIEPIGRMRIGNLSPEEVWGDLLKNLPKGLPKSGERGLKFSRNYDRIYWGGALYCLMADVELRQRTHNRVGLEEALRSIAKQGGTAASNWDADEAVKAGDRGTGQSVMSSLFSKMNEQPVTLDVAVYLRKLGVVGTKDGVRFDDNAPLASIRKAIDGLD